jgi:hypothetical protein
MKNPFRNLDKEEIAQKEAQNKEIELRLKTLSESAKHILSSQDAIKYKKELEEATKNLINLMMNNSEPDPVKFSFFCKSCLNKLSVYYGILESIEADAK